MTKYKEMKIHLVQIRTYNAKLPNHFYSDLKSVHQTFIPAKELAPRYNPNGLCLLMAEAYLKKEGLLDSSKYQTIEILVNHNK